MAKTPQEKAICSSPKLSAADEQMAAAYKVALAATPIEMAAGVRADQREWLDLIKLECPQGRVRFDQDMSACLQQAYVERTKELRHLVQHKGGVTFVWRSMMLMNKTEPASDESDQKVGDEIDLIQGYGTLAISWPQASATNPEWQAWNRAIVTAIQRLASQDKSNVDGRWNPEWAGEDDGDLKVAIGVVNSQMVTAFIDRWGYRGAHPWESSIQFNWLLSEQRELKSDDVFRPNTDWDTIIQQRCMKDLVESLGQHYENSYAGEDKLPDALLPIIHDPENWHLDHQGVTIVFQDYAIAPRMVHPGPVTVHWAELKPYLNPTFTIPKM